MAAEVAQHLTGEGADVVTAQERDARQAPAPGAGGVESVTNGEGHGAFHGRVQSKARAGFSLRKFGGWHALGYCWAMTSTPVSPVSSPLFPPRHVAVAVDVHDADACALAHAVVEHAIVFAAAQRARLCVVTVLPPVITPGHSVDTAAGRALVDLAGAQHDTHARTVATLVERARARGVDASARVVDQDGDVADLVVDAVAAVGADFLMVASHSRTGLARKLLGSVAERIAARARVPVLIVPHALLG